MATTMKKKATEVDTTITDTTAVETVSTPVATKPIKKKFAAEDPITCVSITSGELGMIGIKSRIDYRWSGRGDATDVEYQDLVAAIRSGKSHIFNPRFIITDDDFIKEFPQVKKVYDTMYSVNDLKDVFKLSASQMKQVIMSLPEGARESIKHIAADMIQRGTLDSVQKIKVLDDIYDTKFMLMTQLFDA